MRNLFFSVFIDLIRRDNCDLVNRLPRKMLADQRHQNYKYHNFYNRFIMLLSLHASFFFLSFFSLVLLVGI